MAEKYWYLKNCPLFARLSPDELVRLEARSRAREFPKKSPVYLPAEAATSVLLLTTGRVKLCTFTPEGKQAILAFVEPGEIFGELSLVTQGDRDEYAEAVEKSTIVQIPGQEIERLMMTYAEVSLGITKLVGLRRRRVERRLKSLLFRSNRERLVHLLLELMEQYGRETEEGIWIRIQLSHQDLASVIGSTRETVTLLLGELQDEGFLRIGRRKIIIRAPDRLAKSIGERLQTPNRVEHGQPGLDGVRPPAPATRLRELL